MIPTLDDHHSQASKYPQLASDAPKATKKNALSSIAKSV